MSRLSEPMREALSVFEDGRWHDLLSETFIGDRPMSTFFRVGWIAALGLIEIDPDADEAEETVWARITPAGRAYLSSLTERTKE